MSRHYDMSIEILRHRSERVGSIKEAAEREWPFADWFDDKEKITASGEANLCGGESEEEFTERLSMAIWKANGEFCEVTVNATCLEDLPYEIHCLDEDDYERLINAPPTEQNAP